MKILERLNKVFVNFLPLRYENISNAFPELPSVIFRKRTDTIQFAYPISHIIAEPLSVNHNSEFTFTDDITLEDKQSDIQSFYSAVHIDHHTDDFNKSIHKHIAKDKSYVSSRYHRLWIYPPKNRYKFSNHNIVADNIGLIYMPYHIWNRPLQFRSMYEIAEVKPKLADTIEEKETATADEIL